MPSCPSCKASLPSGMPQVLCPWCGAAIVSASPGPLPAFVQPPPVVRQPVAQSQVPRHVGQQAPAPLPGYGALDYGPLPGYGPPPAYVPPGYAPPAGYGYVPDQRWAPAGPLEVPASRLLRLVARFIDWVVIFLLQLGLFLAVLAASLVFGLPQGDNAFLSFLFFVAYAGLPLLYETVFVGKYGRTPGKRLVGLKVVSAEGSSVGYGAAAGRVLFLFAPYVIFYVGTIFADADVAAGGEGNIMFLFAGVTVLAWLVNFSWSFFSGPARQCLHDKVARTRVVTYR